MWTPYLLHQPYCLALKHQNSRTQETIPPQVRLAVNKGQQNTNMLTKKFEHISYDILMAGEVFREGCWIHCCCTSPSSAQTCLNSRPQETVPLGGFSCEEDEQHVNMASENFDHTQHDILMTRKLSMKGCHLHSFSQALVLSWNVQILEPGKGYYPYLGKFLDPKSTPSSRSSHK